MMFSESRKLKKAIFFSGLLLFGIFLLAASYFGFLQDKKTVVNIENGSREAEAEKDVVKMEEKEESLQEERDIQPQAIDDPALEAAKKASEAAAGNISGQKEEPDEKKKDAAAIIDKLVDFGYQESSGRTIDTIIIHSSYNSLSEDAYDIDAIIDIYGQYGVAAHYLIGRDGTIYRLVEDKNIAYHAGVSQMPDGRKNVNGFSIGIELVNTKTGKMTDEQYAALNVLIRKIKGENGIKYVLGHDQIAPERKDDPWNFEWDRL